MRLRIAVMVAMGGCMLAGMVRHSIAGNSPMISAASPAEVSPLGVLERDYAPLTPAGDPLGFGMKVRSLLRDQYTFWRGGRDFYYAWAKANAADWMGDRDAYMPIHGDLHFGNIGTYAAGPKLGDLGFGLVDFDEACVAPFQLELLSGATMLRLTASTNKIDLTDTQTAALIQTMLTAYREAIESDKNAMQLLADEPAVAKLLAKGRKKEYVGDELEAVAPKGRFVAATYYDKGARAGQAKDVFRRVEGREADFAAGIAGMLHDSPEVRPMFRYTSAEDIRGSMLDVTQRTRVESSGSQGLRKYLVLLRRPIVGAEFDAILYLKQEVPTAAERAGAIARDARDPGVRCAELAAALTDPAIYLSSACKVGGESYWVYLKEPWSDELDFKDFDSREKLESAARILGTVAGAAHRRSDKAKVILDRLTPALSAAMVERSAACAKETVELYGRLAGDVKAKELSESAERELGKLAPAK